MLQKKVVRHCLDSNFQICPRPKRVFPFRVRFVPELETVDSINIHSAVKLTRVFCWRRTDYYMQLKSYSKT